MRIPTVVAMFVPSLLLAGAIQYGRPSELRGVKTIFVDTHGALKYHDDIASRISHQIPVTVVDREQDAEVELLFTQECEDCGGHGIVAKIIDNGETARVLMDYYKGHASFSVGPAKNFADAFVKAYRKANK